MTYADALIINKDAGPELRVVMAKAEEDSSWPTLQNVQNAIPMSGGPSLDICNEAVGWNEGSRVCWESGESGPGVGRKSEVLRGGGGTDLQTVVFMQTNDTFSVQQVREIINKIDVIDKNKISSIPAFQPKAGEVYLYQSNDNSSVASDWSCDGYRWKSSGCRKLPRNKKYLCKRYYKVHTENNSTGSDRFVRHIYSLIDKPKIALIHYMGDESEFVPNPGKPSTCNDYIYPKSTSNENSTNLVNNATTLADIESAERPASAGNLSQAALASRVIEENKICHVSKMGVFVVEGSKRDKYEVTLFPKESCGCPSTGECYHILAAKMSVGMPGKNQNNVINLTQLKCNRRKRFDKKNGRKQPSKNDLDISTILPAPVSMSSQNSVIENPEFDNSNDSSLWLPNHASTPKTPSGILMETEVTPGKKGVEKTCKVTFKDLDNNNTYNNDPQSNKNNASDDEVQNQKTYYSAYYSGNLPHTPKLTSSSHVHPFGIKNPKYHCFVNAILQIIYSVLRSTRQTIYINNCVEGKISEFLFDTAHKIPSAQEMEILKLQLSTYNNFFSGEMQEDAHQCLKLLINIMDKGFGLCPTNDNMNNKRSFSELIFSFVLEKYIICDVCTMKSPPTLEATSNLYVIPNNSTSIQELLLQDLKPKIYKTCSCCGRHTWHLESKHILQPPKNLLIIVNRVTHSNNRKTKNNSRMPLDLYIELGQYKFSLQASVDHHGYSVDSGHFTASINCCGKTFHCDDNEINECNITDTYNSPTAYILLYKLMEC